jgi:predicted Rossmann fold nucleotide-binding protein DprA/Smf involved in DNA uptake
MFKLIVAGCRDIEDYEFVKERIHNYLDLHPEVNVTEIVSGTARGVDTCGEKYAAENNLKVTKFSANWKKYNKAAGPMRNREMAQYADGCICIWDGYSRGTANMIQAARQEGLLLDVFIYPKQKEEDHV